MENENLKSSFWNFDRLSLFSLYACLLVLPLFYLPLWGMALGFSKKFFILLAALASLGFWLLGGLKKGRLPILRNPILGLAFTLLVASFISTLLATSFGQAFVGLGFELDTWTTLAASFVFLVLTAIYFQSKEETWRAYFGLFLVGLILFFYHLATILFFNTGWLPFGPGAGGVTKIFIESLLGKWYDFGAFFGLIALSGVVIFDFFKLEKFLPKFFLGLCLLCSLVVLGLVNSLFLWLMVGLFAAFIFGYKFYLDQKDGLGFRWGVSLVLVFVSLLAVLGGDFQIADDYLAKWRNELGVPVFDVRPSWESTYSIAKNVLSQDSLFGLGPNSFMAAWAKYKSSLVSQTDYWNIDFRFGAGLIPSMAVSLGLVGFVLGLVLCLSVLGTGLYVLFKTEDRSQKTFSLLPFIGSAYLWGLAFFSVPDNYLFVLTFIITGLFVASLTDSGLSRKGEISLFKEKTTEYVAAILFILVASSLVGSAYLVTKKYVSVLTYHKSLSNLAKTGNLAAANVLLERAQGLSRQDLYYQKNSEIYVLRIKELLEETDLSEEEMLANFKTLFDAAVSNAQTATKIGPQNYANWMALGRVYAAVVPLGIDGAYAEAAKIFNKALALNPHQPAILLNGLARLELIDGRTTSAKEYINKTLSLRSGYAPAVMLSAEIEADKGDLTAAIRMMEDFYTSYPQNVDFSFFYQLGYLRYKKGDYKKAIDTLEKVVEMVPIYANARYFLGLSYDALGQTDLALENFKQIKATNPEDLEVAMIIANLENGRRALSGSSSE